MTKQATIARDIISMTTKDEDERIPLVESSNETNARIRKQPGKKKPNELDGTKVTPLVQRHVLLRVDVTPFVGIYLTLIALDQAEHNNRTVHWVLWISFPLALLCHLGLVISQQWKVAMSRFVGYRRANNNDPSSWTHCLVECSAVNETTDAGIVPVTHSNGVAVVNFRDTIFRGPASDVDMDSLWSTSNNVTQIFHRLVYPDHFSLDFYKTHRGYSTLPQVKTAHTVYGDNLTKIQLPLFLDLLGQQLLAPFFLFQLFCVVLWSMDEYWYYAIFTLFALIMFECTVAYNRLKGLERLRGTLKHAFHISCFRHGLWFMLRTDELLPGDVISLTAKTTEINVPADVLVMSGTAVVDEALLTGESIPQLKGPLDASDCTGEDVLYTLDMQDPQHKQSILFGGTNLVSHDNEKMSPATTIPSPPDGGIVCVVLRTGFETAQGSLLRNMAHSSMKSADGIHTKDTFVFVVMLLCCAILSAVSVLEQGWNDETRNRFRLILHVIIIVTSVVPPELPMELSLAVTNSVADLMRRCNVYCTEPYRIPWAGQVDTCCFDKTGTLTSDEMQLRGVRLFGSNSGLVDPREEQIPWSTVRVMAGCNALALRNKRTKRRTLIKEVIGDPLEKAVLSETGYTLHNSNFVLNENQESGNPRALIIHHRFAFSSRLKRMTVLLTEDSDRTVWAVTKGAPETLKFFLTPESLPLDYDEVAEHHMGLGQRVLAMAYRNLGNTVEPKEESRDAVERNLTFCGFLILDCPLKADSKSVITELRKSGHNVVMITGDALLTAAEIARRVGITTKGITYELRAKKRDGTAEVSSSDVMSSFHFVPVGSKAGTGDGAIALSPTNLKTLTELAARSEASFCVSGSVLGQLAQVASTHSQDAGEDVEFSASDENNMMLHPSAQAILRDLVPIISVFARHAPRQKEAIVAAFNLGGCHTLMCGDGTNDVGALKRAHVGISIISAPELEEKHREANATLASIRADQKRERKGKKEGKPKKDKRAAQAHTFQESMRQLQEAQEELDHVELGDASVASPFTSRAMSIRCCKDVLQQGRCTLVTMLQIYKILGVNCLVNALVLTKLHMHGVKQGDRQLTILGIAVAALFFFVSRGKPLPTLSTHRPPSSVLCPQALLSIAIQFTVHYSFIMIATDIAVAFVDPYDPSIIPDARFNPNVLNTCTFLLTMLAAVNTFAVNYRGRPFMEDLSENKLLLRSLQACYFVLLICVTEVFPPLNDLFQLSPFPDTTMHANSADDDWVVSVSQAGGLTSFVSQVGFSTVMCMFMVADTALAFGVEKIIVRMSEGPP